MIRLEAGDYALAIEPKRGGSIAAFRWRGQPLLRETCGPSILDTACFPLVPFSNRIAHGRFEYGGHDVALAPNFPGGDHPHTLHGFGWLAAWEVIAATAAAARIGHVHDEGDWPWPYRAEQCFALGDDGLVLTLSITNLGSETMPAGLGFHPYFPRDDDTVYHGLHRAEWTTSGEGLPLTCDSRPAAIDWWNGRAVGTRAVDTVYAGREGALVVRWPARALRLTMQPCPLLGHTVVYTPAGQPFFCVEPASHATDAINRDNGRSQLIALRPGGTCSVSLQMTAQREEIR